MRAYDVIYKKRHGGELSTAEIQHMVQGFVRGEVPDYQMSALAMAICLQGMTPRETADLTLAMAHSGEVVDLSPIRGIKVDKHSTGGVGDKTSIVLMPLVAACGAVVAKMSGRGLGHTGGTLDKLESFPGLRVELSRQEFIDQVNRIGLAVVGQTADLVPADKKLYALRDVTATVDSVPLIAASVMSKKIAGGADAIVLDVKAGSGAFMQTPEEAFALAEAMVAIGSEVGRQTVAVVTNMDQPLGMAVGNALEVLEAIDTLRGFGPPDLEALCLALGSHLLQLAGVAADEAAALAALRRAMRAGKGLVKLKEMVEAQGGNPRAVEQPTYLPTATHFAEVLSPAAGYVEAIDALAVGRAAAAVGAGRTTKDSAIDLAVGVVLHKKVGDAVAAGESLALVHANSDVLAAEGRRLVLEAFRVGAAAPPQRPLIYGVVTAAGTQRF